MAAAAEAGWMRTIEGVVMIVQESRFTVIDDGGVAHLCVLGHRAAAEPEQLARLSRRQARVRVGCVMPPDLLGLVAERVLLLGE
jgi:hypothetical protein